MTTMPTYYACRDKQDSGEPLNPIEAFVLAYNKHADFEGDPWREMLQAAIDFAAAVPA